MDSLKRGAVHKVSKLSLKVMPTHPRQAVSTQSVDGRRGQRAIYVPKVGGTRSDKRSTLVVRQRIMLAGWFLSSDQGSVGSHSGSVQLVFGDVYYIADRLDRIR